MNRDELQTKLMELFNEYTRLADQVAALEVRLKEIEELKIYWPTEENIYLARQLAAQQERAKKISGL